jgi:hypothetical protein
MTLNFKLLLDKFLPVPVLKALSAMPDLPAPA